MPFVSDKQRRWGNSSAGKKALGSKLGEFNSASKGMDLPESVGKEKTRSPFIKKKKGLMASAMGSGMMVLLLGILGCPASTTPTADTTAYQVFIAIEATADLALDAWTSYKQAYPAQAVEREPNFRALYVKYQTAMAVLETAIRAWRSSGAMVAGTEPPMTDAVNAVEALRQAVVNFSKSAVPAKYKKPLKALQLHPGPAGNRKAA